jgi:hypothetical protein
VLGTVATVTNEAGGRDSKPPRAQQPASPTATEAAGPPGSGPTGRSDGALARAGHLATGAVTAGTGNAMLAPLFLFAIGLLALAALAPAVAGPRWRPVIDRRGHLAVAGLACLAAWAVVVVGS